VHATDICGQARAHIASDIWESLSASRYT
jgi:hypothetical protein